MAALLLQSPSPTPSIVFEFSSSRRSFSASKHPGSSQNPFIPMNFEFLTRKSNLKQRSRRARIRVQGYVIHSREMSEDERRRKEERAQREIEEETLRRSKELKYIALKKNLDSELKLGKVFFNEGQMERAITHFEKVITRSSPSSRHHGEGILGKAETLERSGRSAEAHQLYESLIQFRAPFPDLKRRAVHGIQRIDGVTFSDKSDVSLFEEYLNKLYSDGFAMYSEDKKYVESDRDRLGLQLITVSILLVGPAIALWLVYNYYFN